MSKKKKNNKFLVACCVLILLPAFVLLSLAVSKERFQVEQTPEGIVSSQDIAPESIAEEPEFIVGEPEPLLSSPLRGIAVRTELDEKGTVCYTVSDSSGLLLLGKSCIGIKTDVCDFSKGLSFVRQKPAEVTDEQYVNSCGKQRTSRNYYSETSYTYEKENFYFDVYIRAYENGFAYRFGIRGKDSSDTRFKVIAETGNFSIPSGSVITAELIDSLSVKFCYENTYSRDSVESLSLSPLQYICFPALAAIADGDGAASGKYLLLSEADMLTCPYHGSVLKPQGNNRFVLRSAPVVSGTPTVISDGFLSPWRFGVCGGAGEIALSDMAENLSPAPRGDYSWVKPGVTAWTWLSEKKKGQNNPDIIKKYIDLSAEMGWDYLILDEGWQPESGKTGRFYEGYFRWFDDVLKYAEGKNVGLIIWIKYDDLDTPEERGILREYAAKGVKGIKADFFDSEDQKTMSDLKEIYRICAECHLLVNCHGAGKPTGERRTYPNVICREAVKGEEYGKGFVNEAVIWAYTRNVVGPVDLTPRVYPKSRKGTLALQLASCVLLDCGMPCMAGSAKDYRGFSGASFYRELPAVWDETVFLSGEVGDYVSMARRAGDVWYAATITKKARKGLSMPLDFLGEGQYEAEIYSDKAKRTLIITTMTVTKEDTLSYDLLTDSGYVVRFSRKS